MTDYKINLACGDVYVSGDDWINLDYVSLSPDVRQADLLASLPFPDSCASLVYSSHFLEHIPREQVSGVLRECLRILKPGGTLRLVVPDLENLCRAYLLHRDSGQHVYADFVLLELLDQCIRRESGGGLARLSQRLRANPMEQQELISFVRERTGEDLLDSPLPCKRSLKSILRRTPAYVERLWIHAVLFLLPRAFREQNVSLANLGERHQWLYDEFQLRHLLIASGFVEIERVDAASSRIVGFPHQSLDLAVDGKPRKGEESLYLEAIKP